MNNYLNTVLGFGAGGATAISDSINAQGITSFDDIKELSEKDIEEVCKKVTNPGGMIPNPVYVLPNPTANPPVVGTPGIPAQIKDPGIPMGQPMVRKMKMLWYFLKHHDRVDRPFAANRATTDRLTTIYLKDHDNDGEKEDMPEKFTKLEKIRETLIIVLERSEDQVVSHYRMSYIIKEPR